jgi:hypothetical protein
MPAIRLRGQYNDSHMKSVETISEMLCNYIPNTRQTLVNAQDNIVTCPGLREE